MYLGIIHRGDQSCEICYLLKSCGLDRDNMKTEFKVVPSCSLLPMLLQKLSLDNSSLTYWAQSIAKETSSSLRTAPAFFRQLVVVSLCLT